jgi:hypothetical protein
MRIRRRILSALLFIGLILGLPAQAAQVNPMSGMGGAMAGDELAPSGDCQHCDMDATVDMAACNGFCLVMPALLPRDAPMPAAISIVLRRERTFDLVPGQTPAPDPSPPKASRVI